MYNDVHVVYIHSTLVILFYRRERDEINCTYYVKQYVATTLPHINYMILYPSRKSKCHSPAWHSDPKFAGHCRPSPTIEGHTDYNGQCTPVQQPSVEVRRTAELVFRSLPNAFFIVCFLWMSSILSVSLSVGPFSESKVISLVGHPKRNYSHSFTHQKRQSSWDSKSEKVSKLQTPTGSSYVCFLHFDQPLLLVSNSPNV